MRHGVFFFRRRKPERLFQIVRIKDAVIAESAASFFAPQDSAIGFADAENVSVVGVIAGDDRDKIRASVGNIFKVLQK